MRTLKLVPRYGKKESKFGDKLRSREWPLMSVFVEIHDQFLLGPKSRHWNWLHFDSWCHGWWWWWWSCPKRSALSCKTVTILSTFGQNWPRRLIWIGTIGKVVWIAFGLSQSMRCRWTLLLLRLLVRESHLCTEKFVHLAQMLIDQVIFVWGIHFLCFQLKY